MTSADVEAAQTVTQASSETAVERKENGHMNGGSIENGDANGEPQEPEKEEKRHSSSGHHHSSSRDKDRHKSKHSSSSHHSSSKDKDKHRSSSSHHSSSKDKDRHRSSDKHKSDKHKSDRDKDRHRSDKEKSDKHRSDKDKHKSDKDKHRSSSDNKDRKHHSSSSSKDKDRHSSSHRSENKERHSSSSHHHKDRHSSSNRDKDRERKERKEREHREKEQQNATLNNGANHAAPEEDSMEVDHVDNRQNHHHHSNQNHRSQHQHHHHHHQSQESYFKEEPSSPVRQEAPGRMTLVSETVTKEEYEPSQRDESDDDDEDEEGSKLQPKTEDDEEDNDDDASEAEEASQEVKQEPEDESDDEPLAAKLARVKSQAAAASEDDSDDEPLAVKLAKVKAQKSKKKSVPAKRKKTPSKLSEFGMSDDLSGESDRGGEFKNEETGYVTDSYDSDEPLSARFERYKKKRLPKADTDDSDDGDSDDSSAMKKKRKRPSKTPTKGATKKVKSESTDIESPRKKKKTEDEEDVWKWWEEEKKPEGVKWNTLEHKGPVFAPDYEPLPPNVPFLYNGKKMKLSTEAEEIATFYARMLDHDYTQKDSFNTNFFQDWRKSMTAQEKETITDLRKCDFTHMATYFKEKTEERKNRSKEEKLEEKKANEALQKEYGFCIIDGHKQKIGNFKIEPPGLFRGRGEHPKMGKLKKRTQPEDVIINISKGVPVPKPPVGHKWKEVRHDNTVTWLCCWTENVLGNNKYIMLNPSSKLKGEKDFQKYETARKLKSIVKKIRENYQADWKSKEMRIRQRAVALYFIDKLALRAGNEKDADEQADTVGCCSLRVEHVRLHDEWEDKENVVEFDFLGKDSIRYQNWVPVEKRVFKNLRLFCENKKPGDDLFDRLNTSILNKHLNELMEGLTAKVFRTYNASKTLQEQLDKLTDADMSIPEKLLAYNRANRAVAVLCNHQRAVPKTFEKSMENLQKKIDEKQDQIADVKREWKDAKKSGDKATADKKQKRLHSLEDQLKRLQVQATDREENKQIALGTSKLNYLDPRISVAWCKKWGVPIDKVYNKTQRDKFRWAIEMAEADYKF